MNVIHTSDGFTHDFSVICDGVVTTVLVDPLTKRFDVQYWNPTFSPTQPRGLKIETVRDAESLRDALTKAIEHVRATT